MPGNRERITLDHGAGGLASQRLLDELILPRFRNPILAELDDAATLSLEKGRFALSTDAFTVSPLFFPGGDIGRLSVTGTINDVAMKGAVPLYLTVALVIEEGLPMETLEKVLSSMQEAAEEAGVLIAAGDTKVVPKGACDGLYVTTTGIGRIPEGIHVSARSARPGDQVLVSGTVGDHGIAVLGAREELSFTHAFPSDCGPLHRVVADLAVSCGEALHVLRDPTRGGLAATLNEIAAGSSVGITVHEERIPVKPLVASACEMMGYDPLSLANEGKFLVCIAPSRAEEALERMRKFPEAREAALIGEVHAEDPGTVILANSLGGRRILEPPEGEPFPRIC